MLKKILICALGLSFVTPAIAQNTVTTTETKTVTSNRSDVSNLGKRNRRTTASVKRKWTKRSGIRFGYVYANNSDQPDANGKESKLKTPHMTTMGFELQQCMPGGKWLDVLFIQNISITGLDQSVVSPSVRALIGFEIDKSVQLAVGPSLSFHDPAGEDKYVHLTAAIGYTMDAGVFSVPVHFSFVPDVNDYWAAAVTTGVNW